MLMNAEKTAIIAMKTQRVQIQLVRLFVRVKLASQEMGFTATVSFTDKH
jgi:hypothetical protein